MAKRDYEIHAKIDEKTYETIRGVAYRYRISMAQVVRESLELFFKNKAGDKNARNKKAV